VNDQGTNIVELEEKILSPARYAGEPSTFQHSGQARRIQRLRKQGIENLGPGDGFTGYRWLQLAFDGFDFGKFRHNWFLIPGYLQSVSGANIMTRFRA
jgi:hypothetical protein